MNQGTLNLYHISLGERKLKYVSSKTILQEMKDLGSVNNSQAKTCLERLDNQLTSEKIDVSTEDMFKKLKVYNEIWSGLDLYNENTFTVSEDSIASLKSFSYLFPNLLITVEVLDSVNSYRLYIRDNKVTKVLAKLVFDEYTE